MAMRRVSDLSFRAVADQSVERVLGLQKSKLVFFRIGILYYSQAE